MRSGLEIFFSFFLDKTRFDVVMTRLSECIVVHTGVVLWHRVVCTLTKNRQDSGRYLRRKKTCVCVIREILQASWSRKPGVKTTSCLQCVRFFFPPRSYFFTSYSEATNIHPSKHTHTVVILWRAHIMFAEIPPQTTCIIIYVCTISCTREIQVGTHVTHP